MAFSFDLNSCESKYSGSIDKLIDENVEVESRVRSIFSFDKDVSCVRMEFMSELDLKIVICIFNDVAQAIMPRAMIERLGGAGKDDAFAAQLSNILGPCIGSISYLWIPADRMTLLLEYEHDFLTAFARGGAQFKRLREKMIETCLCLNASLSRSNVKIPRQLFNMFIASCMLMKKTGFKLPRSISRSHTLCYYVLRLLLENVRQMIFVNSRLKLTH